MSSQEEILRFIRKHPGIDQVKLREIEKGNNLSTKLHALRKYGLVKRVPSKKVKMSFEYFAVEKKR